jgi:hypothetical protein
LLVNYPCPIIFDGEIPLFSPTWQVTEPAKQGDHPIVDA